MEKNLILVHLESLNSLYFKTHIEDFPNIKNLISKSIYYDNYYSTATSTLMVISDLIFGRTDNFEQSDYLENIFSITPKSKGLFEILKDCGYRTKYYFYVQECLNEKMINGLWKILAPESEIFHGYHGGDEEISDKSLLEDIEGYIKKNGKFAIFLFNIGSHMPEATLFPERKGMTGGDIAIERFKWLDEKIGSLLELLKQTVHMDDTLLVLYGDHGDDYWGHGIYGGYLHAQPPTNVMTHTPLIVYNPEWQEGDINRKLVSTVDIFQIIKNNLSISNEEVKTREYAFSRNLFGNQDVSHATFDKSYSLTDGKYTLITSCKGLKLFCNALDPFNARNFLDFYKIRHGKIQYNKIFDTLQTPHYRRFWNKEQIQDVIYHFNSLLNQLKCFVKESSGKNFRQMSFNKINYSYDIFSVKKRLFGIKIKQIFLGRAFGVLRKMKKILIRH